MDIFKFTNSEHPTKMDGGVLVNGIKSKLWIERYRDISDFELVANAETKMNLLLPIGCFISHTESTEVMVVENHEINEEVGKETEIKITGRSFESFLENRVVGSNKSWPTVASATVEHLLSAGFTWNQAVTLLKEHIDINFVLDANDSLHHVTVMTDVTGTGESVERSLKRGSLYLRLIELLEVDGLGIKTIRPGVRSPLGFSNPNTAFVIHKGQDLSNEIAFSYSTGELQSADYLWSNKKFKNAALVTGRWLETVVKDSSTDYNRRMMYVDASDLDSEYSVAPTGTERTTILAAMTTRGRAALFAQKHVSLVKAEPTTDSTIYKYRENYEVGDIITVDGEYNETAKMRISEYVEIEDETGQSGYPTLSAI